MKIVSSLLLVSLLSAPAFAHTLVCKGPVQAFYIDWDGKRYTVDRNATVVIGSGQTEDGVILMDLDREPQVYQGPLHLDGSKEHETVLNAQNGEKMLMTAKLLDVTKLLIKVRFTGDKDQEIGGVLPATLNCQ